MDPSPFGNHIGWAKTWWGKAVKVLAAVVLLVLVIMAVMVGRYWWQINRGNGSQLAGKIGLDADGRNDNLREKIRAEVESDNRPYQGSLSAPIVIVEFVDFKCPNCRAAAPIMEQVLDKYEGRVRLVIRNFPIESIHPGAGRLGEAAMCAHEQGKFWPLHDYFFDHQNTIGSSITAADIETWSAFVGLDKRLFEQCLAGERARTIVNQDYALGFKQGVLGTPTFFVNGVKVEGVPGFKDWDNYLKNLRI